MAAILLFPMAAWIFFLHTDYLGTSNKSGQYFTLFQLQYDFFQDLKDFLDNSSEHGVILFTMGFIFQPNAVPSSRIQARTS